MTELKPHILEECFSLRARIGWQGLRAEEFKDYGPYLVTGTDFKNGKVDWDTCYHVTEERYAQDKGIQLKEHDLLITKDGTIGKTAVVESCPEKATLNSGVFVVRAINGEIVPEYLYYILNSHQFDLFIQNVLTGSTIKHLNQEKFYKFKFKAPSVPEQHKIAEVLMALDEVIDRTREIIEKYRNVKKGLLQDLFNEGEIVSLADKRYFQLNPSIRRLPSVFYYIDLESVVDGLLVLHKTERKEYAPSRAQRVLRKNDILFQMVRPYQQNNLFFDLESDLPYVASTGYAQIRTNQNPKYVYYAMHTYGYVSKVIQSCTGSNYPAINSTKLSKIEFRLPERNVQDEIAGYLSDADKMIRVEMNHLEKYENIKLGLLQDLLSGRVDVTPLM